MAPRSVLALKNYQVHSITTTHQGRLNANIATWVMQSALKGKYLTVACYLPSLTHDLVLASGQLNVNLLSTDQRPLVNRLGKQSGHQVDKMTKVPHELDDRGVPYLTESIGYIRCSLEDSVVSLDHRLLVCKVLGQKVLHPDKEIMTYHWLKEKGAVR